MSDYSFKIMDSADDGFWAAMGPFFASREIAKELGGPLYDDPGTRWVIARSGRKIVGWAAFRVKGDVGFLEWSWVDQEHRRRGLWKGMHRQRVDALKGAEITEVRTSTRDPEMIKALERSGMKKTGTQRGSWVQLGQEL